MLVRVLLLHEITLIFIQKSLIVRKSIRFPSIVFANDIMFVMNFYRFAIPFSYSHSNQIPILWCCFVTVQSLLIVPTMILTETALKKSSRNKREEYF